MKQSSPRIVNRDDGEGAAAQLIFLKLDFAKHRGDLTTKCADEHEDFYPRIHPLHPALLEIAFRRGLAGWGRRLGAEAFYFLRRHLKSGISE